MRVFTVLAMCLDCTVHPQFYSIVYTGSLCATTTLEFVLIISFHTKLLHVLDWDGHMVRKTKP